MEKAASELIPVDPDKYAKYKQEKALEMSMIHATKYSAIFGALGLAGSFLAHKYHPGYRAYMSISAKTSVPVMTSLFVFAFEYERKMHDIIAKPGKYGFHDTECYVEKQVSKLPFYKRSMNYFHEHTFQLVGLIGVPYVGFIINQQLALKHLTLSQRIMHSRVFGQVGVIGIIISVMYFKDFMDKNGPFEEPSEVK